MKKLLVILFVFVTFILSGQTKICYWNALHLGDSTHKNFQIFSDICSNFDIVMFEETIKESGVKDISKLIGYKYSISEKNVGQSKYKEYYSCIYNNKIMFVRNVGFYKEDVSTDFEREPFGFMFNVQGKNIILVGCHIIFGKSDKDRIKEIALVGKVYNYFKKFCDTVIIGGDFNEPFDSNVFKNLLNVGLKNLFNKKDLSTLGVSHLGSAYDNIFIDKNINTTYSAVYNYLETDKYKNILMSDARKTISDHFPVYFILNGYK